MTTSTKFILDNRRPTAEGEGQVRLQITRNRRSVYITMGVKCKPCNWDGARCRVKGTSRLATATNAMLTRRLADISATIMEHEASGRIGPKTTAQQVRDMLVGSDDAPTLMQSRWRDGMALWMAKAIEAHSGRTRALYEATDRRLRLYLGGEYERVRMSRITVGWLGDFDLWLAGHGSRSANSRSIHLRNLRRAMNMAIDAEATSNYPYRRYHIKQDPTPKRSLRLEELLRLMRCEPQEEGTKRARDYFMLMFMLMGINVVDLCGLKEVTPDGRVEYRRSKTHKLYSVKVEPEALALIERLRGERALLGAGDYGDYRKFYQWLETYLKKLKVLAGVRGLTSYWARHTWATIAASLDVPKETIARALGHGSNTVTDIYIDFDMRKVDRANRRVLDHVLGLTDAEADRMD